jgi:hypothetical protein
VVPLTSPYVLFTASAKDEKKAMGKAEGDQFEFSLEEMVRCATRAAIAPTLTSGTGSGGHKQADLDRTKLRDQEH